MNLGDGNIMNFNTREIASIIWVIILFTYGIWHKHFRTEVIHFLKFLVSSSKLIKWFTCITIYAVVEVYFLYYIKFWDKSLIKDTIYWWFSICIIQITNVITSKDDNSIIKKFILKTIGFTVLIEFIANFHTFSIVTEFFIIIPITTILSLLSVAVCQSEETKYLSKGFNIILGIIGCIILYLSIRYIIIKNNEFISISNFKNFILQPVCTVLFIPCMYISLIIARYEDLFVRLEVGHEKDKKLKKYSKRKILLHCLLSIKKVDKILKMNELQYIQSKEDLNEIIKNC